MFDVVIHDHFDATILCGMWVAGPFDYTKLHCQGHKQCDNWCVCVCVCVCVFVCMIISASVCVCVNACMHVWHVVCVWIHDNKCKRGCVCGDWCVSGCMCDIWCVS